MEGKFKQILWKIYLHLMENRFKEFALVFHELGLQDVTSVVCVWILFS